MTQYRWFESYSNYTYESLTKLNSKIHGTGIISGGKPYLVSTNVLSITPYVAIFEDGTIIEDNDPPTFNWIPQTAPSNWTFAAIHLATDISGGNPAELKFLSGIQTDDVVFGWFSNAGGTTDASENQLYQASPLIKSPNIFSLHDWYISASSNITINAENISMLASSSFTITKANKCKFATFLFDSSVSITPVIKTLDGTTLVLGTDYFANWGLTKYHGNIPYVIRIIENFIGTITLNISSTAPNTFYGAEVGYNLEPDWIIPL